MRCLIWKLINFSFSCFASLVGDWGHLSLRNVLVYAVLAQRNSQVKLFLRLNFEPVPRLQGVGGSDAVAIFHTDFSGRINQSNISFYKSKGVFPAFGLYLIVPSASVSNV